MKTLITLCVLLAGCGLTPKQLEALGPGDKAVCFHARCDNSMVCGGNWSTTTSAATATDGKVPAISERCQILPTKP